MPCVTVAYKFLLYVVVLFYLAQTENMPLPISPSLQFIYTILAFTLVIVTFTGQFPHYICLLNKCGGGSARVRGGGAVAVYCGV